MVKGEEIKRLAAKSENTAVEFKQARGGDFLFLCEGAGKGGRWIVKK